MYVYIYIYISIGVFITWLLYKVGLLGWVLNLSTLLELESCFILMSLAYIYIYIYSLLCFGFVRHDCTSYIPNVKLPFALKIMKISKYQFSTF